jgi:hypothetical protein
MGSQDSEKELDTGIVATAMAKQHQADDGEREPPPDLEFATEPVTGAGSEADAGGPPEDAIFAFMSRVVPEPRDGESGFINLHWTSPKGPGMRGRAYRAVADLLSMARWGATKPAVMKDIYFCLSSQSAAGRVYDGHPTAVRRQQNVVALKAIWLDIDVKADKGYPSLQDAQAAVQQFLDVAKLPPPSAIVLSGGGVHVYWISDRALPKNEWQPYAEGLRSLGLAHGLKFDTGVTINSAQVLRVPGTFNNKTNPPKPVTLASLGVDYDFGATLAHVAAAQKIPGTATVRGSDMDEVQFPKKPIPPGGIESLAEGIRNYDDTPLDPAGIFLGCPFFRDAAETHGAGHDQPLWHLTVLASTFWQDAERWAHELSKGHPNYTREEAQAMFNRKIHERRERGLGWPSCKAFEGAGCKLCATCAYRGKIKSPLYLAARAGTLRASDDILQQIKEKKIRPIQGLMALHQQGAAEEALFAALNETYSVVRYGSQVLIASVIADEIFVMKAEDFHKMFGNVRIQRGFVSVEVSRAWFEWPGRRQYLGRGVVFEPGGPLDIADDMLNLWRGFGIEPKQGDWSLMRAHICDVVCSGRQQDFDYLLKWMAYAVQNPNEPIGVAVAFRGAQGAGKGVVARTFGKIFGRHFAHIANGDQLTGRFNASLATSCAVFLDEALWAGDRKGEGVLKALITEPRLQLEAKFKDPIMVDNRLRIMVASNSDWMVPAGIGDRRWFVLDVANTYAGTIHKPYWDALYAEIENGGAAAMFYDLLAMDLSGFDVRAVPHTAAKAQQQAHSLHGTEAWLHHVLHEGVIGCERWQENGLTVSRDHAYGCYEDFSKRQRDYRPETRSVWSKKTRAALGPCLTDTRGGGKERVRSFQFKPLADCRGQFASHLGALEIEWEADDYATQGEGVMTASNAPLETPAPEIEPATEPDDIEWEPLEPEPEDIEWEPPDPEP